MKIVIAPDKFKEALSAREVCAAIERGIRRVLPEAVVDAVPMADGGEGTVDALVAATGGQWRHSVVTDPLGRPVEAAWGMLGEHGRLNSQRAAGFSPRGPSIPADASSCEDRTAVIEMAAASGLALVPADRRDPTRTTTYGTGELIRAALDAGATRILVGIGGSATTDGGAGAAQALGIRFERTGKVLVLHGESTGETPVPQGLQGRWLTGGDLPAIARIDLSGRDERIARTRIEVACDVDNPLLGSRGAAAIYGPQKGATPEQVEFLDRALGHLADLIERDLGKNVREFAGAGAAGGLGAGLVAFCDAVLRRGVQMVIEASGLAARVRGADLVITGEGRLDGQSMMGKVIAGVAETAKSAGVPVIALVGCTGEGADEALRVLRSYHTITPEGTPLPQALAQTAANIELMAARYIAQMNSK